MTRTSHTIDEGDQKPVISIQSDWENVIFSTNQEIWISCKFLGKESVHSKLQSNGKKLPICASGDFSVLSFSQSAIKVQHNASKHIYSFVPPVKTFSRIHKKRIMSVNVASSGLGVSSCAEDKLIVWNLVTGDVTKTLDGHVAGVYKCKFFPSGIVVISAGADMQLKIWSAETGDCPVTLTGHKAAVNDISIVDRGRNVVSVSKDGTAILWDCGKSAALAEIFRSDDTLNSCSIGVLPDDLIPSREEAVSDREIGTKNKLLVIGSEEGRVYGVSIFCRKTIFVIETDSAVNLVLILSNQIIIGCHNGKIEIYKLSDVKNSFKTYHESSSPIVSGCVYKESGFFVGRNDGTVTYYDCQSFSNKRISLTGSDCDPVTDISCLNNKVFTGCRDGKIRQYVLGDLSSSVY